MASIFKRIINLFCNANEAETATNITPKPVINKLATAVISIPDVRVADEIIDTSSLFYDLLFNNMGGLQR